MNKKVVCLVLLAAAFLLMWPAIYNHGPFFFGDTPSYVRGADAAVYKFTHHASGWTSQPSTAPITSTDTSYQGTGDQVIAAAKHRNLQDAAKHGIFLGRSIYYGVFLYAGYLVSGFWLSAYLQALLVASCLFMLLRHLGVRGWKPVLYLSLFTAGCTCASFVSSMLMPDILVGTALLGMAVLATTQVSLSRSDLCFWAFVLCVAELGHDSAFLITALFVVLLLAVSWRRPNRTKWVRLGILAGTLLVGFLGQSLFKFGIRHGAGTEPFRLPYLTARLIEDGPGTAYLRATCPGSGFAVCQYVDQLPRSFESFLFATNDQRGIFLQAPAQVRRDMANQQLRLFFNVLRYSPGAVLKEFVSNTVRQLTDYDLHIYNLAPGTAHTDDLVFPNSTRAQLDKTRAYAETVPTHGLALYFDVVLCGCLLYLVYALMTQKKQDSTPSDGTYAILGWVCVAVFLNAAVCGCLSGVYGRFGTRAIWIVPVMALILWMKRVHASAFSSPISLK